MSNVSITSQEFISILSGDIESHNSSNINISPHNIEFNDITVTEKVFLNRIAISKGVIINGGHYNIEFGDVVIKKWFNILSGNFGGFIISDFKTEDQGHFSISGGHFQNVFEIKGGVFDNNFTIDGGEFENGMKVTGGHFKKYFQITGGFFKRWVEFCNCKVDDWLYLHRASFEYGIQIHSGSFGHLNIWDCPDLRNIYVKQRGSIVLNRVSIKSDFPLKAFFTNITIHKLDLTDTNLNKDVNLIVSDCHIDEILFKQFVNFGYISFNNIRPLEQTNHKGIIEIKNSNLGKIDFLNCDLNHYKISFKDSQISDISLIGGKFNRAIEVSGDHPLESNTQKKLFNGQLKKSFEKLGDLPASIDAHSDFMNAHYEILKINYKKLFSWDSAEISNIWLNKISNNHGKSTGQSFGILTILSMLLYTLYCYSLGYQISFCHENNWGQFWGLASYYLEFINPIHKIDTIPKALSICPVPESSRTIDAISRIIISYLLYQFIQAFRKYGKGK